MLLFELLFLHYKLFKATPANARVCILHSSKSNFFNFQFVIGTLCSFEVNINLHFSQCILHKWSLLVESSDLDSNTVTFPFDPLVAYYLDHFVLAVFLGNCILADLVLMKNLPMKHRHPADAILLGVVHEMAEVCWHCLTVFDHSDPVVDNTADDHKCRGVSSNGTDSICFLLFVVIDRFQGNPVLVE